MASDVCTRGDQGEECKPETDIEKVKVWVGYQAKCPECTAFLNGSLSPVWQMIDVREKISLELNVYGNTREYPIEEVSQEYIANHTSFPISREAGFKKLHVCHHGPGECLANFISVCAHNMLPNGEFVDLVLCMAAAMRGHHDPEDFKSVPAARHCFKSLGIEDKRKQIFKCATHPTGGQLLTEMGARQGEMFERKPATPPKCDSDWDRPGVRGEAQQHHGPAVFVNGVYLADNTLLLETICSHLEQGKPASCLG